MACLLCCGRKKKSSKKMSNKKFVDECLKEHNECRKKHGVSNLKLNKEMCATAQKWADHLAATNTFSHSNERMHKGERMGENIAMKWNSSGEEFTGKQCVQQWYDEVQRYDFNKNGGPSTGHFTQIVWKDSKELGVGRAQTSNGKYIVVCNYLPAGNFIGKNAQNVFPPKGGKITSPSKDAVASPGFATSYPGSQLDGPGTITTRSGSSYSKTVVTETTIGPDGKSRTITKEIVSDGPNTTTNDDFFKRFQDMSVRMGMNDNQFQVRDNNFGNFPVTHLTTHEQTKEKKPQKMKEFIDEVVKYHNKYRKTHGKVGDVKHNKELSELAQKWAEHLASIGSLQHSNDKYKGTQVGENVASKWATGGADYTGQEVVDQWYSEQDKYDYRSPTFRQGTGHFSQVVWKNSKEIGVGKAFGRDGRVFVVCNYCPPGNVMGQFPENVFPAKK